MFRRGLEIQTFVEDASGPVCGWGIIFSRIACPLFYSTCRFLIPLSAFSHHTVAHIAVGSKPIYHAGDVIDHSTQLDWSFDPLEALRRWPLDQRVLMLHSGRSDARWARWSVLASPVGYLRFDMLKPEWRRIDHTQWLGPDDANPIPHDLQHKPFTDLRQMTHASGDGLWIGYLSYDLARRIERLPTLCEPMPHWPVYEFGHCPGYLVFDHLNESWHACGNWRQGGYPSLDQRAPHRGAFTPSPPVCGERQWHEQRVQQAKDYIAAGDIFQVNLAHRFRSTFEGDGHAATRTAFDRLAAVSPAWYGAYLECPIDPNDLAGPSKVIASTSPELFLDVDQQGHVITRPIKGTRPTSVPAAELLHSAKDKAELTMIVDLLRNDLGRVCAYGSVRVTEPRTIETHPTIHHGVSTIEGDLHATKDVADLLRATMPGGSITGAPKVRAMEIIDELEAGRRGPYCGAIGFISQHHTTLNIAIRTLLMETATSQNAGQLQFSVGGGIVADSDPAAEYQETLDKAQAMLRALKVKSTDSIAV